jgi:hypothetical protein
MVFLLFILLVAGYVGVGFATTKAVAVAKEETFIMDWNKILLWPKMLSKSK